MSNDIESCMDCDSLAKHGSNDGPCDKHKPVQSFEDAVTERLSQLTTEQLAIIGRPKGKPSQFKHIKDGFFVYEVMSKLVPAHHAEAAREILRNGKKAGETDEDFRARLRAEFIGMRTVTTFLSREKVGLNAAERIIRSIKNGEHKQIDTAIAEQ